jgi:hypothetical protein
MSLFSRDRAHPRRTRHYVSPMLVPVLRLLFRHSGSRDAYVLRGVGNRMGPVLRPSYQQRKPQLR